MNLLTNAVEAIPETGEITIRTARDNGEAHIEITDTGVGIAESRLPHLFEPGFSQRGNRVKAGMGLFTCYSIIEKHSGKISAASTLGEGSTFTIRLPIRPQVKHTNE